MLPAVEPMPSALTAMPPPQGALALSQVDTPFWNVAQALRGVAVLAAAVLTVSQALFASAFFLWLLLVVRHIHGKCDMYVEQVWGARLYLDTCQS